MKKDNYLSRPLIRRSRFRYLWGLIADFIFSLVGSRSLIWALFDQVDHRVIVAAAASLPTLILLVIGLCYWKTPKEGWRNERWREHQKMVWLALALMPFSALFLPLAAWAA